MTKLLTKLKDKLDAMEPPVDDNPVIDNVAPRFALLDAGPERLSEVIEDFFAEQDVKLKECGWDIYNPDAGEKIHMPYYGVYTLGGEEVLDDVRSEITKYKAIVDEKQKAYDDVEAKLTLTKQTGGIFSKIVETTKANPQKKDLERELLDAQSTLRRRHEQLTAFEAGESYLDAGECRANKVWPYIRALEISTIAHTSEKEYDSSVTITSRLFDREAYALAKELAEHIHEELPELTVTLGNHHDIACSWLVPLLEFGRYGLDKWSGGMQRVPFLYYLEDVETE